MERVFMFKVESLGSMTSLEGLSQLGVSLMALGTWSLTMAFLVTMYVAALRSSAARDPCIVLKFSVTADLHKYTT